MSILPTRSAPRKAPKVKRSSSNEVVVFSSTAEPLPGWTVAFVIVDKPDRKTTNNPDGRFIRFTEGLGFQPDRSLNTALAYAAAVDAIRRSNA